MAVILPEPLIARIRHEPDWGRKIGIGAGEAIRQAAILSSLDGDRKHKAVRESLKRAIFGEDLDEEMMEQFLDDLLDFDGITEWLTDRVIGALPLMRAVDAVLDTLIRATYKAMKTSGIAL